MANSSSSNGGLFGLLSGPGFQQMIQSGMLGDIGMGLLSASRYGSDPGASLENALAAGQQRRLAQQQYNMNQYQLNMLQAQAPFIMQALQGAVGSPQGQAPAQSQSAPQAAPGSPPIVGGYSPRPQMPAAPPQGGAPQGQPQQPTGDDPWSLIQRGTTLQAVPQLANYGKAMVARGQAMLANDPRYVTQRAVAANQLTQDQAALANTAPGSLAYRAAQMKYLKDAGLVTQSSMNGAVQTFGGITPAMLGMSTTNPIQGVQTQNGVESPIPGAAAAQQALAGARARGEAQGDVQRVWNPQTQQWQYVPRSSLLGGPSGTPAAGASGAAPLAAAPNPMLDAYLRGTGQVGAQQVGSLQNAANAAQKANLQLAQILADSQDVVTGPGAAARKWMDTTTAAVTQLFGVAPPKSLASYQELDKYGNQLAFAMTRQLGSREAGQIVQLEMQSNPNKSNVPQALRDLVGSAHAANDFAIAQNQYVQTVAQRNGGNAELGQASWSSNTDPRVWQLAISPEMAAKWAPRIGLVKIAKVMPYMLPSTALDSFRNLPRQTQVALTKRLDPSFMQRMVDASQ